MGSAVSQSARAIPGSAVGSGVADLAQPPTSRRLVHLRPRNATALLFVASCLGLTGLSISLSFLGSPLVWVLGQVFLSVALLQWFVLLHEAGHLTLFRTKWLNICIGHIASFFAVIPFRCWKLIHDRHHLWTGWQDLDATTEPLVPRTLGRAERIMVNVCWKFWVPLFSFLYRVNNFWNLPRLRRFSSAPQWWRMARNIFFLLAVYAGVAYLVGVGQLLHLVGFGLLLSMIFQDPLLLSQHTHIPQNLSHGKKVHPFPATQQEVFTRSLKCPPWFSSCVLMNLDAHELHHMYRQVPGYHLRRIHYVPRNEVYWWEWLRKAKRVSGEVFLFQNRAQSGLDI